MTDKEKLADRIEEAMTEIIKESKFEKKSNDPYLRIVDFNLVEQVANKHGFNAHYLMKIGNFINK